MHMNGAWTRCSVIRRVLTGGNVTGPQSASVLGDFQFVDLHFVLANVDLLLVSVLQ